MVSKEFSKFCKCGGKLEITGPSVVRELSPDHAEAVFLQQKELEVRNFSFFFFSTISLSFLAFELFSFG